MTSLICDPQSRITCPDRVSWLWRLREVIGCNFQRILPAIEGHHIAFVTTNPDYRSETAPYPFYAVKDASSWSSKLKVVLDGG